MSTADTTPVQQNPGVLSNLDSRRDLVEWFAKNAPSLGQLYVASLRMLDDRDFPGRGYLICHAVREIGNRLPNVVATLPKVVSVNWWKSSKHRDPD
jgi:hypothetical protein